MELLIDAGNTNLKWACAGPDGIGEMRTLRHHGALPIDLHAAWELLPPPDRVLIANVGGESLGETLRLACRAHWGREPRFARPRQTCCGVTVAYAEPARLGADRWLALLAARREVSGPVLVVDAGTAVTYDLLLADGRHLGGLILPGMRMMRESLLAGTRIPAVEPADSVEPWAADTGAAVAAASVQAPAALAERLRDRLAAAAGQAPTVLITGGDAERLAGALERPARPIPDLVLRGLTLLPDC